MAEAALGLGSNLGDKAATIERAIDRVSKLPDTRLLRRSRLYRTEPWGDTEQDFFLNACALVETTLPPEDLLDYMLGIELVLGRTREKTRRWGPRSIDIDLLFYGDEVRAGEKLTLPHPHLFERAFVLIPLAEIAGGKILSGRRLDDAAKAVDSTGIVVWTP
ncbi:2-amino-4-hydroxy-6-hydroxymethyldihydropteridine diphosphokinase [Flaviflagellibacter deserti]|uniref:2-amino-4-hydroxy-6-hydroxymethyldihydropteridine pyrophosphokinase n=1 Tax=Flaviflagellibacter deserti TaxID=2267266 RepID=A0ABV9YZW3_9HYPH